MSQGHDEGLLFKDKDKDCIVKDKDQDKDCISVSKESLRTRTRTNITGLFHIVGAANFPKFLLYSIFISPSPLLFLPLPLHPFSFPSPQI